MVDRPILFSAPMVRALLEGRKTQTRRVIKPRSHASLFDGSWADEYVLDPGNEDWRQSEIRFCVGDRLYVRETLECANDEAVGYPANGDWLPNTPWVWKRRKLPAIHMPRALSRITLLVTDVRVQRLQDCSEADALAEGYDPLDAGPNTFPTDWYADLWDSINGTGSWAANPWIAAISFTVHQVNIDAMEAA